MSRVLWADPFSVARLRTGCPIAHTVSPTGADPAEAAILPGMVLLGTPDLLSPEFYGDIAGMHDAFRAMRAQGPVWRDEANALWAVVHHAPIIEVERNAEVFSSLGSYRSRIAMNEEDMIAKDDPAHHDQRALVARRFTPKAVQRLEPVIESVIDELLGAVRANRARWNSSTSSRRRSRPSSPRTSSASATTSGSRCGAGRSG